MFHLFQKFTCLKVAFLAHGLRWMQTKYKNVREVLKAQKVHAYYSDHYNNWTEWNAVCVCVCVCVSVGTEVETRI